MSAPVIVLAEARAELERDIDGATWTECARCRRLYDTADEAMQAEHDEQCQDGAA